MQKKCIVIFKDMYAKILTNNFNNQVHFQKGRILCFEIDQ